MDVEPKIEATSSSDAEKSTWRTDFSIESLLRKQPDRMMSPLNENGATDIRGSYSDDEDLRLRMPFCPKPEIIGEFESDPESSSSPEPINSTLGPTPNSRFFGISEGELTAFPWLSCTRFKPPKLPRTRKRVGCKRYGRGPRIPFAPHQIAVLESTFTKSQYLSSDCIHSLADTLHLSETRVKIWFQNRRARYRREREAASSSLGHGSSHGDDGQYHGTYHAHHSGSPTQQRGQCHPSDPATTGPLDLCRSLDKKTFEHFMNSASADHCGNEKRKLLFPDLIAQQLQRYREVQEYILQQEQRNLNLYKHDESSSVSQIPHLSSSPSRHHGSILQSVLQSSPAIQFPFQGKAPSSPSSVASETQSQEAGVSDCNSSHRQFMQFDSIYPFPQLQHPYEAFSLQFR